MILEFHPLDPPPTGMAPRQWGVWKSFLGELDAHFNVLVVLSSDRLQLDVVSTVVSTCVNE